MPTDAEAAADAGLRGLVGCVVAASPRPDVEAGAVLPLLLAASLWELNGIGQLQRGVMTGPGDSRAAWLHDGRADGPTANAMRSGLTFVPLRATCDVGSRAATANSWMLPTNEFLTRCDAVSLLTLFAWGQPVSARWSDVTTGQPLRGIDRTISQPSLTWRTGAPCCMMARLRGAHHKAANCRCESQTVQTPRTKALEKLLTLAWRLRAAKSI